MVMSKVGRVRTGEASLAAAAERGSRVLRELLDDHAEPEAEADLLLSAAALLERAVLELPITHAERSYLGSTSSRLRAISTRLQPASTPAPAHEEPDDMPKRPARLLSRIEAARVIGCAPNTLLNLEARGVLTVPRDYRGWRVYDRETLARAMALVARVPLADMEERVSATPSRRRR